MVYLGRETLIGKTCNSIYKLVICAAKRALEIADGQPKLVEAGPAVKPSTVALMEISADKIECKISKAKE